MNDFPKWLVLNWGTHLEIVRNASLCSWILIVADDTATLVAITVYGFLGTYLIAVFVLYARFSTNKNVLFVKGCCFAPLTIRLVCSDLGPVLRGVVYCIVVFVVADNMPVTWCYRLEDGRQYCSTGFPMGCYVRDHRNPEDICMISVCCNYQLVSRYDFIRFTKYRN